MDLERASHNLRLLSDSTRIRLLLLLEQQDELSVAELAGVTRLAQPRVSTHLAKLKEAQLVSDRRDGVSVFYRIAPEVSNESLGQLWSVLRTHTRDPLVARDRERLPTVLAARAGEKNWADAVAGDMERHYSPGRTWEATTRSLTRLLALGDVVDIASGDGVLAELLAPQARSLICLDISSRVVEAGRNRLTHCDNVRFEQGDMHDLPLEDASADLALLMHALTYTKQPQKVFKEAARVLRPGGQLLAVTLEKHQQEKAVLPYNHQNLGFTAARLKDLSRKSGLDVVHCETAAIEKRAPHFSVLTLLARKPI